MKFVWDNLLELTVLLTNLVTMASIVHILKSILPANISSQMELTAQTIPMHAISSLTVILKTVPHFTMSLKVDTAQAPTIAPTEISARKRSVFPATTTTISNPASPTLIALTEESVFALNSLEKNSARI